MQTKWPGPAEESGSPVGMQVGGLVMAERELQEVDMGFNNK